MLQYREVANKFFPSPWASVSNSSFKRMGEEDEDKGLKEKIEKEVRIFVAKE